VLQTANQWFVVCNTGGQISGILTVQFPIERFQMQRVLVLIRGVFVIAVFGMFILVLPISAQETPTSFDCTSIPFVIPGEIGVSIDFADDAWERPDSLWVAEFVWDGGGMYSFYYISSESVRRKIEISWGTPRTQKTVFQVVVMAFTPSKRFKLFSLWTHVTQGDERLCAAGIYQSE
jgi:hypothetical protein